MQNWSTFFQNNFQPPATVCEAVARLLSILNDEDKTAIASMREEDLIDLHFGLGAEIRNAFGLHDKNSRLLADCGAVHPDDASDVIINKIWERLAKG